MTDYIDFRLAAEESLVAHPTSNLYFLLDHSGLPDLHSQLKKTSLKWKSLFDCTPEASALHAAPILILAGSKGHLQMPRVLCEWIGRNGTYTSTVLMLLSPLQLEPLVRRLEARLEVKLSEDIDAMLRFFDPRVFESLTKILDAEQASNFFSSAEAWQYVDRTGRLVWIASSFDANDKFLAPLVLTQQQESELLDASEVDQVLDLLRSNLSTVLAELPPSVQYGFVSQKIETARKIGICSIYKLAIYIAIPLIKGAKFIESPCWQRFLMKLKQDDLQLTEDIFYELNS